MRNKKLELHQQLLNEALAILNRQDNLESMYDFDPEHCMENEKVCIMEYSAKLAGIMQLSFNQISNAKPIGIIKINENGVAEPAY